MGSSIALAKEEAWKEFERTGEITNAADNFLEAFDSLEARLSVVNKMLTADIQYSYEEIEKMRRITDISQVT